MSITRRQLSKSLLGMGLSLSAGGLLVACGGDGDSDAPAPAPPPPVAEEDIKTFHFDLYLLPPEDKAVLRVGGRRYPLQRHTDATRAALRQSRPRLAALLDRHLTHFVEGVAVSAIQQQRMHVTTFSPTRGHGVALVAMHIPLASRIKARRARGLGAVQVGANSACPAGEDCCIQDQVEDDYLTGRSTAKALITHYPDVLNLDKDISSEIEAHMDGDQAAAVDNLSLSICIQGPAYEHKDGVPDGWAVLNPQLDADGKPILDSQGDPTFDYVYSDKTNEDLPPAIAAIVQAIHNDEALDGRQYEVIYHGDPVDTASLPEPNQTPLVGAATASAPAAPQALAATSQNATFSTLGYHHNVLFYGEQVGPGERQFSLRIMNLNYVWYGLYLEYLDASGKPLTGQKGSGVLNSIADAANLETDSFVFYDIISSPPTIFGIPTPFPYRMTLSLPEGASQVRLSLVGPGAYGDLTLPTAAQAGSVLTAVLQYMLPLWFLTKGSGINSTQTLIGLILNQTGVWLKMLSEGLAVYSEATGSNKNDYGVEGSLVSLFDAMVQNFLLIPLERFSPELWAWIGEKFTAQEIEEGVPFSGWIMRAVSIAGTIGGMVATTAEIATNPMVIGNTVSFTHSVNVKILTDPDHGTNFPANAYSVQVQITAGTKALDPVVVPIGQIDDAVSKTVVVPNVPLTGSNATVTVIILALNGYPLAHSAAVDVNGTPVLDENGKRIPGDVTFLNNAPASGDLLVVVPSIENPVPITAQTLYSHHQSLRYQSGQYGWSYTKTPPALEPLSCGTGSGLCDLGSVTVWLPGGMIGYSWLASSPGITSCTSGAAGQLHNFQNLSLKFDPNPARKTRGCGTAGTTALAYDSTVQLGQNGMHFYLDAVRTSDSDPEYQLRRLVLDNTTPVALHPTESWGRFRLQIDRMAVYNKGSTPRVVAISSRFHKLAVLEVPSAAYTDDKFGNNAKVMSGKGESNDALMLNPTALTIADNGAVLVLQGGAAKSVKAFDFDGKPWKFFKGGTSSVLPLVQDATEVTWLDICIEPTNLLYVLSHTGSGTQVSDFRLDIYDSATGNRVVRNTGIAVARITVDKFRGLYSLNYETVKGSPIVEPSVSVWQPSVPPV